MNFSGIHNFSITFLIIIFDFVLQKDKIELPAYKFMEERFPDDRNLSILPVELKVQLGFKEDPQQQWLFKDDFACVGGVELYEWLPTRLRVSMDGTRYQVGAWKQDLEGLLALARILHPQVQDLDTVKNFWKGHKKFSVTEDRDLIYIGIELQPTPIAFEVECRPTLTAYELALTAVIKNMTYEDLAADKLQSSWLKYAEKPNQRAVLFNSREFMEFFNGAFFKDSEHDKQEVEADPKNIITVDTLREFPLATNKTSLNFAPTTVVRDGVAKEFDGIWLIAHNGRDPKIFGGDERVDMYIHGSTFNHKTDKWEQDRIDVHLQIPEGVEVQTVEDMVKVTKAEVSSRDDLGDEQSRKRILGVAVTVEDGVVKVVSQDGSLSIEVRKPTCDECKIPMWKFPWPKEYEFAEQDGKQKRFSMHSVNTSLGVYRCQIRNEEGGENTYCYECVQKVEDRYAESHPFVLRGRAIEVARAKLDNLGYEDVEIDEDQVWRTGSGKGWEFFTKLEYDRDGRRIIRHTGIPVLTDEGIFESNMLPREYVTFRYQ